MKRTHIWYNAFGFSAMMCACSQGTQQESSPPVSSASKLVSTETYLTPEQCWINGEDDDGRPLITGFIAIYTDTNNGKYANLLSEKCYVEPNPEHNTRAMVVVDDLDISREVASPSILKLTEIRNDLEFGRRSIGLSPEWPDEIYAVRAFGSTGPVMTAGRLVFPKLTLVSAQLLPKETYAIIVTHPQYSSEYFKRYVDSTAVDAKGYANLVY